MRSVLFLILLAVFLPIITVFSVNELSPKPVTEYSHEKCTRFCHNHGCKHKPEKSIFNVLYSSAIYWLGNNPFGLGYKQMNILVFVILWPGFMLFLLIVVLLNHQFLRKLKFKLSKRKYL